MERRATYNYSSNIDCFEIGYWSYHSCSSYRMFNREYLSTHLLGWELVRNSIAWMVFCAPEVIPEHHVIEFEHHTIDIEVKISSTI
jgi:hypothetical protein